MTNVQPDIPIEFPDAPAEAEQRAKLSTIKTAVWAGGLLVVAAAGAFAGWLGRGVADRAEENLTIREKLVGIALAQDEYQTRDLDIDATKDGSIYVTGHEMLYKEGEPDKGCDIRFLAEVNTQEIDGREIVTNIQLLRTVRDQDGKLVDRVHVRDGRDMSEKLYDLCNMQEQGLNVGPGF